jgi:hypothetical protein
MRKLAVLAMMIAIAAVMVAPMASADEHHHWWGIHGTWEMVATGSCLHSTEPFSFNFPPTGTGGEGTIAKPFVATPHGNFFISYFLGEGTWRFDRNGKGTMQVTQYCMYPDKVTQALMPSTPVAIDGVPLETLPFEYEVEDQTIKVTVGFPVYLTLVGKISSDQNTITLFSTMQEQNGGPTGHQVCNIGRILSRLSE